MIDSVHWWNGVVNFEEDSDQPPAPVSPSEMAVVWQEVSPVFHTHVIETGTEEEYWEEVRKCLVKLTDDDAIPDPSQDFPKFVEKLYFYRDLIKISSVDSAINYAKHFCPESSNTFFVSEFLYAVSDPSLSVQAIHEMNTNHIEPWASYISRYGAIERFFDLFITFLQPANRKVENEYESFRLILAEIMTSLICDNCPKEMTKKETIVSSLYSRLLNLVIYSKTEASVSFARFAIAINLATLHELSLEVAIMRIVALINASPAMKMSHPMVLEFALSQGGKYIPFTLLAQQVAKHVSTIYDLNILAKLGGTSHDARFVVVRTLSMIMVQSKVLMSASAKLLTKILKEFSDENEDIKEWVQKFITLLFVYFNLCAKKEKYLRRVHMICSCLSNDIFLSIDFLKKTILQNANACYLLGNCQFLLDYFVCGEEYPFAKFFKREATKAEQSRTKLKTFPFKSNAQLVETTKSKKITTSKSEINQFQRDAINELGLPIEVAKYLYKSNDASTIDQQNCIFTLEDFVDQSKEKIDKIKSKKRRPKIQKMNMLIFTSDAVMTIFGLREYILQNENAITEFQIQALSGYIDIAREIISVLKSQAGLMADTKLLNRDLNRGSADDSQYKHLKDKRIALKKIALSVTKKFVAPRYADELASNLTTRIMKFDSQLQYSPPSQIDVLLIEFLKRSMFSSMIDATASVLEDGTIDAAVSTIWELNSAIIDSLSMPFNQNAIVLYNALVRTMFDYAYVLNPRPTLNRYKAASSNFIAKSIKFSAQPISMLNISMQAINAKRQQQPISTLFRAKSITLEPLEFMTNPLDIIYYIHQMINSLSSQSLTRTLTPPEIQTMLLGLVVSTPPSNIVAVAKFIEKWGNLISSSPMQKAKQLFLNCVNEIVDLDTVQDDN